MHSREMALRGRHGEHVTPTNLPTASGGAHGICATLRWECPLSWPPTSITRCDRDLIEIVDAGGSKKNDAKDAWSQHLTHCHDGVLKQTTKTGCRQPRTAPRMAPWMRQKPRPQIDRLHCTLYKSICGARHSDVPEEPKKSRSSPR